MIILMLILALFLMLARAQTAYDPTGLPLTPLYSALLAT